MADEKAVEKAEAKGLETKSYKVKAGAEILTVEKGERKRAKGGDSVKLTEKQAQAFRDKIEDAPENDERSAASVAIDHELVQGAKTMQESNALAGAAQVGESETEGPAKGADAEASAPAKPGEPAAAPKGESAQAAKK